MSERKQRILIVDDDRTVCQSISLLLQSEGYETEAIYRPDNVEEHIENFEPDLLVLDMNFTVDTSGNQGLAVLERVRRKNPHLPVILLTGWGTLELAVKGMKAGANDFVTKPWDNKNLLESIRSQLVLVSESQTQSDATIDRLVGESKPMQEVKKLIKKIAPTDAMVLITGESGTGKELVAEAIHDLSRRSDNRFVKVNLGGLSPTLFESELFGHKRGAFTGAIADREGRFKVANGGSIFLDEIGEVPLDLQVKLLRVLQERTYEPLGSSKAEKTDTRVISATHRDLPNQVKEGAFREDLYYRINLMQIHLPSLRERKEDIPLIVDQMISRLNDLHPDRGFSVMDEAYEFLSSQSYPGNIRQLKNIVERTYLLASNRKMTLEADDFAPHFEGSNSVKTSLALDDMTLDEMERMMVIRSLESSKGNISASAESLGITRSALYRRMEKYNLER